MNPRRAGRKFDKAVEKAGKQLDSGALNPSEDFVNVTDMTPAQQQAYSTRATGQGYVDLKREQTLKLNEEGKKDFQKKGGTSKTKHSFFNPSLSKTKK